MRATSLIYAILLLASCNQSQKMNTKIKSKAIVELPAQMVWKKLISFGNTERFVPQMIKSVDVTGTGIGAIRTIHLIGGGQIMEKLTKIDQKNKVFEFIILSTPMPISDYTGTFSVRKKNTSSCEVTFESIYKVSAKDKDEIDKVVKNFQATFLSNLEK